MGFTSSIGRVIKRLSVTLRSAAIAGNVADARTRTMMRFIEPSYSSVRPALSPALAVNELPVNLERVSARRQHLLIGIAALVGIEARQHDGPVDFATHNFDSHALGVTHGVDAARANLLFRGIEDDHVAVDDEVAHAVAVGVDSDKI